MYTRQEWEFLLWPLCVCSLWTYNPSLLSLLLSFFIPLSFFFFCLLLPSFFFSRLLSCLLFSFLLKFLLFFYWYNKTVKRQESGHQKKKLGKRTGKVVETTSSMSVMFSFTFNFVLWVYDTDHTTKKTRTRDCKLKIF